MRFSWPLSMNHWEGMLPKFYSHSFEILECDLIMLLEFCLLSLFSLTLFFLQFPFALCVSFIFLVSLVFSSSFLICFARQHHHLVFFLLLVMWHELSTLTWIWSPPTGGSWWSQLGCYSSWGLPYILQFQVSGHACDCQLFSKHSSGFLFFQNLSMLRLGFLLSSLQICCQIKPSITYLSSGHTFNSFQVWLNL